MILGFVVSRYMLKHVDKSRKAVKTAVLTISAVAALMLLLKPLF
jgi:hypothetical protein